MVGLNSVTFAKKQPEEIVEIVKEAGLQTIEWWGKDHVPVGDIDRAKEVKQLTEKAGLSVSSYGSYFKVGEDSNFDEIVETAKALGTNDIRVWAGETPSEEVSNQEFWSFVEETEKLARQVKDEGINLHFEYHNGTLTDTPKSAERLMTSIEADNVFIYWQPNEYLSVEERIDSLNYLSKWITNVHVFNWEDPYTRFALADAKSDWTEYIRKIESKNNTERNYLMEFVKDDSVEQFKEDAETLKEMVSEVL